MAGIKQAAFHKGGILGGDLLKYFGAWQVLPKCPLAPSHEVIQLNWATYMGTKS